MRFLDEETTVYKATSSLGFGGYEIGTQTWAPYFICRGLMGGGIYTNLSGTNLPSGISHKDCSFRPVIWN